MDIKKYCFTKRDSFSIGKFDTADTDGFSDKEDARKQLRRNVERMAVLQDKFYAQDKMCIRDRAFSFSPIFLFHARKRKMGCGVPHRHNQLAGQSPAYQPQAR